MSNNQKDVPDPRLILPRLLGPRGPELTCEQCFELLDEYVELEHAKGPADEAVPGMRAHLEGCLACSEEHESLLALLQNRVVSVTS